MPRARSINKDQWQTAAASEDGSGCLSFYWIPPLSALFIACLLAIFALKAPLRTSALQQNTPALLLSINAVNNAPKNSNDPLFNFTTNSSTGISPIFSKEIQYWAKDIVRWADASSLDPNLIAVVMQIESCGDPRAISRSGAMGLFQVMPFHFHITDNPFNPDTNALRGLDYLSRSLNAAGGNVRLAMAGYNGGIGVISRTEWNWPAETRRYVQIGVPIYEDARSGATTSPAIERWYGRSGLCRQARNRLGISE